MITFMARFKVAIPVVLSLVLLAWSSGASGAVLATPQELSDAIYAGNTQLVTRYLNGGGDPHVCVPIRPPKNADPAWSVSANWCMNLGRLLIAKRDEALALLALRKGALLKSKQIQDAFGVAIRAELPRVVEALINLGANVNQRAGAEEEPPLWNAAYEGNPQIVAELAKAGADINAVDPLGYTPIGIALDKGHEAVADYLIQHGASLVMKSNDGYTLLMAAAHGGSARYVAALALLGFDVNASNGEVLVEALNPKLTPIKRVQVVRTLLQYGADPCLRDKYSRTALDYAKKLKEIEVIKILQKAQRACSKDVP
nr:ankyrin repeat domain-containing protein [Halomonas sp.]